MSERTERCCDRCGRALPLNGRRLEIEIRYHHPTTLDLCDPCERSLTFWLGKTPHAGLRSSDDLAALLDGRVSGDGVPTRSEVDLFNRAMEKLSPRERALLSGGSRE